MLRRILLSACLALAVGILIQGCSVPQIPEQVSWDTELELPLAARTYGLWDLADTDSVIEAEGSGIRMTLPDSALSFTYRQDLEPVRVGDRLTLDAMDYTIERPMEALRISADVRQEQGVTLGTMNPAVAAGHGSTMDVPAFPFEIMIETPLNANFSLACLDSGQLDLTIRSTLPYPVQSMSLVWLGDRSEPEPLYSGDVPATSETTTSRSLAGTCLTETMYLEIQGTAAGGSGVLIDSTQGLWITLAIGEVLATTYVGPLPRQELSRDTLFTLDQQHEVHEGEIAAGYLTITAANHTPFADSVRLVFADLYTPAGEPVTIEHYLLPDDSAEEVIALEGHTLRVADPGTQQLRGRLEAITPATGDEVQYEANAQYVTAVFRTSELRFRRFAGVLHNLESTVEPDSSEIEQPPEGWENVHPAALDLRLRVRGGLPVASQIYLDVHSTRQGGVLGSESRTVQCWLGGDTTVVISGLSTLMPEIPEWIGYAGRIVLNGPVTVYDTTSISGSVELVAPLRFTLENTTIPGDAEAVELETEELDEIQEVTLRVRLWNALPLAGQITLYAAADSVGTLDAADDGDGMIARVVLPPAQLAAGHVAAAGLSEVTISPPPAFYDLLTLPRFYMRSELALEGSAGDTLIASGTDYVKVAATARVRYRISTED